MFDDILVATGRNDLAEAPVRHRTARERRFLDRLVAVALELAVPTDRRARGGDALADEVEVQTDNASTHALELARFHGARLHVLVTVDAVRYDTTVEFATTPLVEEGEETVDRLVDAAERAGLAATGTVEVGRPARLIAAYADEHDVDLIVLNARRAGGRLPRLRGRLTTNVLDLASVPVYAVPRPPGRPD